MTFQTKKLKCFIVKDCHFLHLGYFVVLGIPFLKDKKKCEKVYIFMHRKVIKLLIFIVCGLKYAFI